VEADLKAKICALFHILILTGTLAIGGPLKVRFSNTAYSVVEEDASATITVQLTKTTNKTVTVDFTTSEGTATGGVDYTHASGLFRLLGFSGDDDDQSAAGGRFVLPDWVHDRPLC